MKTSTPRASPESSARDPQDVIRNPENVPKKFASLRRLSLRKTNKSLNTGAAVERREKRGERQKNTRKEVQVCLEGPRFQISTFRLHFAAETKFHILYKRIRLNYDDRSDYDRKEVRVSLKDAVFCIYIQLNPTPYRRSSIFLNVSGSHHYHLPSPQRKFKSVSIGVFPAKVPEVM